MPGRPRIVSALHQMRRHIERTGNEFREGAPDFDRLHKAFHTSLLAACGSKRLLTAHSDLYDQAYRYRRVMMRGFDSGKKFVAAHQSLADLRSRPRCRQGAGHARGPSALDAGFRLSAGQKGQIVSDGGGEQAARFAGPQRSQIAFSACHARSRRQDHRQRISASTSSRANSSASSARPVAARPPRCGWRPDYISRPAARVTFDGKPMLTPRRDIAIVFQDYGKALLPWRTAAGNVSLALEASGVAGFAARRPASTNC